MRCPKCQYLSFDNGDRCRNCGYEFSLAIEAAPLDLAIQDGTEAIGPLADLDLRDASAQPPVQAPAVPAPPPDTGSFELPLFTPGGKAAPPVVTPATPRPPLSVRRNAPAPRPKAAHAPRAPRSSLEEPLLALDTQGSEDQDPSRSGDKKDPKIDRWTDQRIVAATPERSVKGVDDPPGAPIAARTLAAVIDLAIVGGIDAGVFYLTLRVLELHVADVRAVPLIPFVAFLLLLNGSYFAAFVAAGGQTIGKMAVGIRVIPGAADTHSTERVPVGSAVLRAAAYIVSALPAGVGFLPGLMSSDHRALHDRLADTRVVKA